MKNKMIALVAALFCLSAGGRAAESGRPSEDAPKSLTDEIFTVETSEDDASESLDRISGNIDRGFSSKEYTYKSPHHGKAGPFAYEQEHGR